jgi:hypothetical protein
MSRAVGKTFIFESWCAVRHAIPSCPHHTALLPRTLTALPTYLPVPTYLSIYPPTNRYAYTLGRIASLHAEFATTGIGNATVAAVYRARAARITAALRTQYWGGDHVNTVMRPASQPPLRPIHHTHTPLLPLHFMREKSLPRGRLHAVAVAPASHCGRPRCFSSLAERHGGLGCLLQSEEQRLLPNRDLDRRSSVVALLQRDNRADPCSRALAVSREHPEGRAGRGGRAVSLDQH